MNILNINIDNVKFTDHFSVAEMFVTSMKADNSQCSFPVVLNLLALCAAVLEPARQHFGKPIKVNSGYRSKAVNDALREEYKRRGVTTVVSDTSQHMTGEAADITLGSKSANKELFEFIKNNLTFDQLINESDYTWIHVSFKHDGSNRNQIKHLK